MTCNMLRAIALATTCLAPLAAFADDFSIDESTKPAAMQVPPPGSTWSSGSVGFGFGAVGGSNLGQAGRYSGVNTNGVIGGLTDFNIKGGSTWSSGDAVYYDITGENLLYQNGNHMGSGLNGNSGWAEAGPNHWANAGSLSFKAGEQGTWGIHASYDAITYTGNVIDSLYTVAGGSATLNNGLAPWGGAGHVTSFTIAQLRATGAMEPFQVGTRRDIFGTDFKYQWKDWTITGGLRHENKTGSMEEAFDGPYGGTAFALPIDYDTDRFDLSAAYNTRAFQAMLQYTFSRFTDNNLYVNLPYPTWKSSAPNQQSAAYSLPPSTDAHYFTVQLADNDLIPKTRLNLNARFGLELQDNFFAPNTADPNPSGAPGFSALNAQMQGTTDSSPGMVAEVYQIKASAASRPYKDVDTRVFYGVDGRSVSLNQYKVNVGGTGGSSDSQLSGLAYVVPQDWLKQNAGAEVGYNILPDSDTKLTAGYRFDDVARSNAQVGHSSTNTGTVALTSTLGSQVDGKLSFEYADRSASLNYLTPWANLGAPSQIVYSGAYYQAPMTSESVTARADYTPMETISTSLFVQFKNEDYHYPAATAANGATPSTIPLTGAGQGIKQDFALEVGPDVNFRPNKDLNIHLFYTYEMLFYNNTGNGACSLSNTGACAGSAGYFQNKQTSSTHTAGVSGDWQITDKLKLSGEYTWSYGTVMFGEYNGVFVSNPTLSYQNVANYPDINSLMNSVKLRAIYKLTPNIDLALQGSYTSFHNNDWNDTANPIQGAGTTAISILTPGYQSPKYTLLAAMAGVRVRF